MLTGRCGHRPLHFFQNIQTPFGSNAPPLTLMTIISVSYTHLENSFAEKKADEQYKFFVSDSVDGFLNVANIFLDKDIGKMIEKIDIERY